MAYKRKVRILFVSGLPGTAQVALAYAIDLAGHWIEASCAYCRPDISQPATALAEMSAPPCPALNAELLLHLDLIVTLDKAAKNRCHSLLAGVRKRHYELASGPGEASSEEIRQLILGIMGGIKMLARNNDNEP